MDNYSNLFPPLPPEARRQLENIPALIEKTFPMPGRFRAALPANVAELSRLLTSGRGERGLSYLGQKPMLSAYLRYFLPWNLYRLCRLLPNLGLGLAAHDHVTDLGCGPLTLAAALWISRPDLREIPLEFHCIDRSGPVLEAGKIFFTALAGSNSSAEKCKWNIHTVKSELNDAKLKPSSLICAVNVFNEMFGDFSRSNAEKMKRNAEKAAKLLSGSGSGSAAMLIAEPGFPRCGEFISLLRKELLERGLSPSAPCTHGAACPLSRQRWCHFAFETDDAPSALLRLSAAAGIPKERAVISFLFMGLASSKPVPEDSLRVISDAFPLPYNSFGRYCCSRHGLVLLSGEKNTIMEAASGSLASAVLKKGKTDAKSGALLAQMPDCKKAAL